MNLVTTFFRCIHALMALLFALAAIALIGISAQMGWDAVRAGFNADAAQQIIEAIGLVAAAVVALQIAETIVEEEIIRDADISAPTRVRRFLSRFFVVLVVALAIEGLVATFKANHENPEQLPYAAALLIGVGVLLAAWGVFIHLNRSAEELEPEAMADAKDEDDKLK
jgi:heme A synthase